MRICDNACSISPIGFNSTVEIAYAAFSPIHIEVVEAFERSWDNAYREKPSDFSTTSEAPFRKRVHRRNSAIPKDFPPWLCTGGPPSWKILCRKGTMARITACRTQLIGLQCELGVLRDWHSQVLPGTLQRACCPQFPYGHVSICSYMPSTAWKLIYSC